MLNPCWNKMMLRWLNWLRLEFQKKLIRSYLNCIFDPNLSTDFTSSWWIQIPSKILKLFMFYPKMFNFNQNLVDLIKVFEGFGPFSMDFNQFKQFYHCFLSFNWHFNHISLENLWNLVDLIKNWLILIKNYATLIENWQLSFNQNLILTSDFKSDWFWHGNLNGRWFNS